MSEQKVPASGNQSIDHGHGELSRDIEDIVRHWKLGSGDTVLEACVRKFRETAARHFDNEIAILDEMGAETGHHRQAHDSFLSEIENLLENSLPHNGNRRWFSLVETLERMLFEHEIIEDSRYYSLFGGKTEPQPG
jgi:hemerythrin-like metal-binding protein